MFLLLFTYVFGGAIAGSPHAYLMFALPGIIVQNSLFATLNTGVGLSSDLDKGFLDRLRALPVARFAPLAGRIAGRRRPSRPGRWCMLLAVGAHPRASGSAPGRWRVLGAFGLLLAMALAFSWAIVLVGMLAANPEKVQIFGFVVLFPLTFTSDAFVRTASMPGWLQAWSKANPVSLLADAARGLLVAGPVTRSALESLLCAVGFTVVFAPLAVRAFKRKDLIASSPAARPRRERLGVAVLAERGAGGGLDPRCSRRSTRPACRGCPGWRRAARRPGPGRPRAAPGRPGPMIDVRDHRRVVGGAHGGQRLGVPGPGQGQVALLVPARQAQRGGDEWPRICWHAVLPGRVSSAARARAASGPLQRRPSSRARSPST